MMSDRAIIQLMRECARIDDALDIVKFEASRETDVNKQNLMRLTAAWLEGSLVKKWDEIINEINSKSKPYTATQLLEDLKNNNTQPVKE